MACHCFKCSGEPCLYPFCNFCGANSTSSCPATTSSGCFTNRTEGCGCNKNGDRFRCEPPQGPWDQGWCVVDNKQGNYASAGECDADCC